MPESLVKHHEPGGLHFLMNQLFDPMINSRSIAKQTLLDHWIGGAQSQLDEPAFSCNTASISHGQLLQRCMQLTSFLDICNIARQEPVALLMPRTLNGVVAAYGVMYGARIWVAIDPASPVAVIRQMLVDCGIRMLLTDPQMNRIVDQLLREETLLQTVVGVESCVVDAGNLSLVSWQQIADSVVEAMPPRATSDDVAYVIHTSGSTGKPKGIVHTHFSALSYAQLCCDTFGLCRDDVIGCHGPLHTDMCTMGLLAGPLAGASTQIVPEAHVKVPASLSALIESSRMTVWYSVPQVLIQMLEHGALDQRDLGSLRWIIYAGEAIAPVHLLHLMCQTPVAQLCNVYGPAEINQCTHYVISGANELKPVPIGSPWPETRVVLLDECDQLVDDDNLGELAVHSSTMMQGYWHDDRPAHETFFDNPRDGLRYYRTGDLARRNHRGVYTLSGRRGRQVKVRGMRVELDAIELILSQHPKVEVAAAIADQSNANPGGCRIRAFVTLTADADPVELQVYMRRRVPMHAVPETIEVRSSIPLTSGGKIDRLRLVRD